MLSKSRNHAGAALLAAWISIPAMVEAQATAAEQGLMNRVGPELPRPLGEHPASAARAGDDHGLASRALLGTGGAIRFGGGERVVADLGSPSPEQALRGQAARPKNPRD
jgi:hypothetical protein